MVIFELFVFVQKKLGQDWGILVLKNDFEKKKIRLNLKI